MRARTRSCFAAAAALGPLSSCHRVGDPETERPDQTPAVLAPSASLSPSPELIALGRTTYDKADEVAVRRASGRRAVGAADL